MKHLFIVNPFARHTKGQVKEIVNKIDSFFESYQNIEYQIHVTRWCRDAVGFVHRYLLQEKELVRIYAVGGTGTLFEVINGAVGMPNVQIACYPLGYSNSFIRYFGDDKKHLFLSLKNMVFSDTTPIDLIRCGTHYAISFSTIGLESESTKAVPDLMQKTKLNADLCYIMSAWWHAKKNAESQQKYKIMSATINESTEITSLLIANSPCYGRTFTPAPHAHPNSSNFDFYLTKKMSALKVISTSNQYLSGNHKKLTDTTPYFDMTNLTVSSDSVMSISIDGEMFYSTSVDYEIIPYGIDFVCPRGIDIEKIPRLRA